jgi:hypothetical protein
MKPFFVALAFILFCVVSTSAQTVHDYVSVDFSPSERKLGVFSSVDGTRVIDLKVENMSARDKDILTFFATVQELEAKGWEVTDTHIFPVTSKGFAMYVWFLRRAKS